MVNLRESKGGAVALAIAEARKNIPFAFYESWSGNTSSLKTRARESGNVEWNSAVLDPRKIYNNARILLVPSQAEEAWGMVASEAQCSGIPVIGSDIGGLTEAIGSGGIKISPEAPIATWLDTVDRLWSDDAEWQRVSDAALAYARRSEIQLENQISILEALICLQSVPQGFSFTLNDSQLGTHLDSC
jgi:glycosyltransferase involved in cell wall biosynthesis